MIAKECSITLRIQKLEALLKGRLSPQHLKYSEVAAEYSNRMAGYRGEKSLDFHLSMLEDSKYYIFHGLRLLYRNYYFQIDNFLLCSSFGLILEVKNMAGELRFEKKFNQMFQKKKESIERKTNPVLQAKLQAIKLKKWLKEHNCPEIPIYYLFVNSNAKTIIMTEPGNEQINRFICNSEFLIEKITQLENANKTEILDSKELRKIKRLLLANHTPENPDILAHFNLSKKDSLTGVQCPECNYLPMYYKGGLWVCPKCRKKSKTAHLKALEDYFLLISPSITNKELRQFLHIDSINIAQKILFSMNLPFTGRFKDRVYHQPPIK
ncbi:MAG TPA: nuclease-related domain-containing protein [Neobacillus sp.]